MVSDFFFLLFWPQPRRARLLQWSSSRCSWIMMSDVDSRATLEDLKRTARILLVVRMNVPLLP